MFWPLFITVALELQLDCSWGIQPHGSTSSLLRSTSASWTDVVHGAYIIIVLRAAHLTCLLYFFPLLSAGKTLHGMEKQLILIANAHMHWDPEYSDVKLVQTMMFLSEVKNIVDKATRSLKLSSVSGETNAIPLVLCADLNSLPDSGK